MATVSVSGVTITGLQRAARMAGESFGHEDATVAASSGTSLSTKLLWCLAAVVAIIGLAALALR